MQSSGSDSKLRDFLGQEITPGVWVVYPRYQGTSLDVQIGFKVGNLSYKEVKVSKGSVMQRPDRAVVVIEHQIPSKFRDAVRETGL